jgi:hypothetical protein
MKSNQRPPRQLLVEMLGDARQHAWIGERQRAVGTREHAEPPQPGQRLVGMDQREAERVPFTLDQLAAKVRAVLDE